MEKVTSRCQCGRDNLDPNFSNLARVWPDHLEVKRDPEPTLESQSVLKLRRVSPFQSNIRSRRQEETPRYFCQRHCELEIVNVRLRASA